MIYCRTYSHSPLRYSKNFLPYFLPYLSTKVLPIDVISFFLLLSYDRVDVERISCTDIEEIRTLVYRVEVTNPKQMIGIWIFNAWKSSFVIIHLIFHCTRVMLFYRFPIMIILEQNTTRSTIYKLLQSNYDLW